MTKDPRITLTMTKRDELLTRLTLDSHNFRPLSGGGYRARRVALASEGRLVPREWSMPLSIQQFPPPCGASSLRMVPPFRRIACGGCPSTRSQHRVQSEHLRDPHWPLLPPCQGRTTP